MLGGMAHIIHRFVIVGWQAGKLTAWVHNGNWDEVMSRISNVTTIQIKRTQHEWCIQLDRTTTFVPVPDPILI